MQNSSARPTGDIETAVCKYGDALYRLCLVMLKNESDAQDAVQEALLRAWTRLDTLREERYFETQSNQHLENPIFIITSRKKDQSTESQAF